MMRSGVSPSKAKLDTMSLALKHRGPDGDGQVSVSDVGLVHRRLSIIDLEKGGQPLCDKAGNYLVGNAEIYNYRELGAAMPEVELNSASDCEPPLHLYGRHGLDFTKYLRGMYALAIYDQQRGRLVLARDPFGIKPLYFVENNEGFFFASEIQALLRAGCADRRLCKASIGELLNRQFVPGDGTIFLEIQRVMPGETLVVEGGKIVRREKIEALSHGPIHRNSFEELERELDRELTESINFHQRSDVPYGLFFSGGVDSSCLLAAMARESQHPIITYTAGFDSQSVADETLDARRIAEAVGAKYSEVRITQNDFWNELPTIAAALDDPCADYAIIPSYILARQASKDVKVVLSGEGGDELFAGYGRYRRALRPRWIGGRIVAEPIFDKLGVLSSSLGRGESNLSNGNSNSEMETELQRVQAKDFRNWLPNDLLLKLDRCLMAHGLEGRTPFLDRRLVEFAFRLPDKAKLRHGKGKWLLRQWLSKRLPQAEAFTKKRGFTVPVREWMETGGRRLGELVAAQPGVQEVCERGSVAPLFCRGGKRTGQAAWRLLFFALWHRKHVLDLSPDGGNVYDCLSSSARY
jgi:asparagine synthase (glutamine-hydrolysing)